MSIKPSTAEDVNSKVNAELSSEQVAEFLKKNPNFFAEHDDLILDLTIPHESGKAISLL